MCLSSCQNCSFYTRPLHNGDVGCSVNPYYWWLWFGLQGLDASLLPSLPIDECKNFELKEELRPIEINLTLTRKQIKQLISRCSDKAILEQFKEYIDVNDIRWIDVDSECINSVAYDWLNYILKIRFNSGSIYQYNNVPTHVLDHLLNSASKGHYFNSYIKDIYDFQLVN